jgi:hypothetical protein
MCRDPDNCDSEQLPGFFGGSLTQGVSVSLHED